jgi:hypothetical protein
VEDVAASWEQYGRFAEALAGPPPAGLIVHAAGPTDEGFRIVALWESEEAWRRFAERVRFAEGPFEPFRALRALQLVHVVYGSKQTLRERDGVDRGGSADWSLETHRDREAAKQARAEGGER